MIQTCSKTEVFQFFRSWGTWLMDSMIQGYIMWVAGVHGPCHGYAISKNQLVRLSDIVAIAWGHWSWLWQDFPRSQTLWSSMTFGPTLDTATAWHVAIPRLVTTPTVKVDVTTSCVPCIALTDFGQAQQRWSAKKARLRSITFGCSSGGSMALPDGLWSKGSMGFWSLISLQDFCVKMPAEVGGGFIKMDVPLYLEMVGYLLPWLVCVSFDVEFFSALIDGHAQLVGYDVPWNGCVTPRSHFLYRKRLPIWWKISDNPNHGLRFQVCLWTMGYVVASVWNDILLFALSPQRGIHWNILKPSRTPTFKGAQPARVRTSITLPLDTKGYRVLTQSWPPTNQPTVWTLMAI